MSGTSTSRFGSSRRESHDASDFYRRFTPPDLNRDTEIVRPERVDSIFHLDAREMGRHVRPKSVALVVTSPPYFAGKEYEETLGSNGVPGSYFEYLELLRDVFAECKEALEPGGRIAVNVANLGRRPYRSLSADVITILQDLGLLLRGEVIWWKGRAAGGSCAWGTFQRPGNPVLRDVTERIVIASKGRFDRAKTAKQRHAADHPSTATISRDEFLEATTDLWELPPASATRVGHPAPFPVELPARLIDLYTYRGDLVLDPFMGAGTTAVAAVRTERHYVGFETDQRYVERATERLATERRNAPFDRATGVGPRVELPAVEPDPPTGGDARARAVREGRQAKYVAEQLIEAAGFVRLRRDVTLHRQGIDMSFVATDRTGVDWAFDVSGAFTTSLAGLKRADTLWRTLGKASVLHESGAGAPMPLVLLTTDVPTPTTAGHRALAAVTGPGRPVFDVVEILDPDGQERLRRYGELGPADALRRPDP